jgi:hypothetical protein
MRQTVTKCRCAEGSEELEFARSAMIVVVKGQYGPVKFSQIGNFYHAFEAVLKLGQEEKRVFLLQAVEQPFHLYVDPVKIMAAIPYGGHSGSSGSKRASGHLL